MIISIHEYELAAGATIEDFEIAVSKAESRELFELPGLDNYEFLYGIKGARNNQPAAIWTYESRETWRALWGSVNDPVSKAQYPEKWLVWEDDLLAPILCGDPDEINYTSYQVIRSGD